MIPKIIHYCWFGGAPLDKSGVKCVESWKKYFPDYEIIEWNESNFDINSCRYAMEAYKEKKYAFVSDYVRFKVLYAYGGLYFDTDVEVIKSFDDILAAGNFMGCQNPILPESAEVKDFFCQVNPGLGLGAEPGLSFYKEIIEDYEKSSFYKEDGTLNFYDVVDRVTDMMYKKGLRDTYDIQEVEGIKIYPADYFCPQNVNTGKMEITSNSHSIHRFAASWVDKKERLHGKVYRFIARIFGQKAADKLRKLL